MEELRKFDRLTEIDERHELLARVTGQLLDIEKLHNVVSNEILTSGVPEDIHGQYNVARNMAVYTYYLYSLAPEVHMKTYAVMEMGVRRYYGDDEQTNLKALLQKALDRGVISDSGFRDCESACGTSYTQTFVDTFPKLRNSAAHGSSMLVPHCVGHIRRCADFLNQLFPAEAC